MDFYTRAAELNYSLKECSLEIIDNSKIFNINVDDGIKKIIKILGILEKKRRYLYLIGNGGSAGVVSHSANDFINMCNVKAITFHDISVLTCLTNDYGYENAYKIALSKFINEGDVLVAVSSSGRSKNIINAVKEFKLKNPKNIVITLTGFKKSNPLKKLGNFNFWINSNSYGIVEIAHQFILHNISDQLCFKKDDNL